ncbi:MAG: DCC1-like thiol-disulfide oxidoreductase family protein [Gemmatimonadaceae bacterium]
MSSREEYVLLYDGLCGFCDGAVQFIMARDKQRTLTFAALQGDYARALIERHPELRDIDSLVFVRGFGGATSPSEVVLVRSDAVVAIAKYLGGAWSALGMLMRVLPRAVRDWGYDRFAGVRYRIFGRRDECRIPSAEERARFID